MTVTLWPKSVWQVICVVSKQILDSRSVDGTVLGRRVENAQSYFGLEVTNRP